MARHWSLWGRCLSISLHRTVGNCAFGSLPHFITFQELKKNLLQKPASKSRKKNKTKRENHHRPPGCLLRPRFKKHWRNLHFQEPCFSKDCFENCFKYENDCLPWGRWVGHPATRAKTINNGALLARHPPSVPTPPQTSYSLRLSLTPLKPLPRPTSSASPA